MDNLIIDIDGTLLNGTHELNNASSFIRHLETTGRNYLLATNSIKSHDVQVKRFRDIGVSVLPDRIFSPIDSINSFITKRDISNVMIIGSDDEVNQIHAFQSYDNPELIILLDFEKRNLAYNDLQMIINAVESGCPMISASASLFYFKNGRKQIDTGAFVLLIESISNSKVEILGKPSLHYFLNAESVLNPGDEAVTVIGDDWQTDILGAKEAGFRSALIKSGKYIDGDENKGKPDLLIDDFNALIP